ncbi:MAG: glycerate kinase [Sphingobacteriaceae bacterium]|nr:glycerate kinase [Sphingobacteriaceae bacterium]
MNILIAPDKFKHSLSNLEACEAMRDGLLKASKSFSIQLLPLADGGDGLSEVLQHYLSAKTHQVLVSDPLFRSIRSCFLVSEDGKTAFIEMAKASGLLLLKPEEQNCMFTTTLGTGELIREAIGLNIEEIILGIGGSATNDCGMGMAAALGYRFLDKRGNELSPVGRNLINIDSIDQSGLIDFKNIKFTIACDVTNPLLGTNGSAKVYARQKGASDTEIDFLESGMRHFAHVIEKHFKRDIRNVEGSGAAGGMGAGSIVFLNADLISGIDLILKISDAEEQVRQAEIVLTGEGKIDEQSLSGKVIAGIGKLCHKHKKPLIAFCGELVVNQNQLNKIHVTSAHSINDGSITREEAFKNAGKLLSKAVYKMAKGLKSS